MYAQTSLAQLHLGRCARILDPRPRARTNYKPFSVPLCFVANEKCKEYGPKSLSDIGRLFQQASFNKLSEAHRLEHRLS